MSTTIPAEGRNRPFTVARNGNRITLCRRSQADQMHRITFTAGEVVAVTNALIDAAEQLEQDK